MADFIFTFYLTFQRRNTSELSTLDTDKSTKFVLKSDKENESRKRFKRLITFTAKNEQKTSNMSITITCQNQHKNPQDDTSSKTQPKKEQIKRSFPNETPMRPQVKAAKRLKLP